jgi:hypothetical protein
MFLSPWIFDFFKKNVEGWIDLQADGAAHQQPRCQSEAGDGRMTSENDMRLFNTTESPPGQALSGAVYNQFFFLKK